MTAALLGTPCREGAGWWPRPRGSDGVCSQTPEACPAEQSAPVPSLGPARSPHSAATPCAHGTRLSPCRLPSLVLTVAEKPEVPAGPDQSRVVGGHDRGVPAPVRPRGREGAGRPGPRPPPAPSRCPVCAHARPGMPRDAAGAGGPKDGPRVLHWPLLGPADQRACVPRKEERPGSPAQPLPPLPRGMLHSLLDRTRGSFRDRGGGCSPQTRLWASPTGPHPPPRGLALRFIYKSPKAVPRLWPRVPARVCVRSAKGSGARRRWTGLTRGLWCGRLPALLPVLRLRWGSVWLPGAWSPAPWRNPEKAWDTRPPPQPGAGHPPSVTLTPAPSPPRVRRPPYPLLSHL